jgi:hypothetical protein
LLAALSVATIPFSVMAFSFVLHSDTKGHGLHYNLRQYLKQYIKRITLKLF